MRRSFWFTVVLTVVLGAGISGRAVPARAENPLPPPGRVNSVPFTETGFPGLGNLPSQTSLPSSSPHPQGAISPGASEDLPVFSGGHRSLGSLFELKRQETLLKREIAIKKLKDQLKGPVAKKILTGTHGSPMTLLAAGIDGNRYAILEWPDGRRIRVREGEHLPDGTRVLRIDGSGVSVKKRKDIVTWPYGESSRRRSGSGAPQFPGFSPPPAPYPMGGHP